MGVGVAVVGRRFGCRVQVPALRAAGFDVVALVGRDLEPTAYKASKLGIPHACGSLAEALALPDVDAVTIATPPHTHFALALEAVEAGRHVLCEKPFTTDAAQAAQLVDAQRRAPAWSVHSVTSSGGTRRAPRWVTPSPPAPSVSRGSRPSSSTRRSCCTPTTHWPCRAGSRNRASVGGSARTDRTPSTNCGSGSVRSAR